MVLRDRSGSGSEFSLEFFSKSGDEELTKRRVFCSDRNYDFVNRFCVQCLIFFVFFVYNSSAILSIMQFCVWINRARGTQFLQVSTLPFWLGTQCSDFLVSKCNLLGSGTQNQKEYSILIWNSERSRWVWLLTHRRYPFQGQTGEKTAGIRRFNSRLIFVFFFPVICRKM